MANYSDPTMQDRLNRASDTKAATLDKFKRAVDPNNPKVIEARRQREAIATARAEREAQREIRRQEEELELARQAAAAA